MTLLVRPEAKHDITEAARWYESKKIGLGLEFVDEIASVFDRVARGPKMYAVAYLELRRALAKRFPYAVYFKIHEASVIVMAVLHQRRDQNILSERLED